MEQQVCQVCGNQVQIFRWLRLVHSERLREILSKHRTELANGDNMILGNARICFNCNARALLFLDREQQGMVGTMLMVHRHRNGCSVCPAVRQPGIRFRTLSRDSRAKVFLETKKYIAERTLFCEEHLHNRFLLPIFYNVLLATSEHVQMTPNELALWMESIHKMHNLSHDSRLTNFLDYPDNHFFQLFGMSKDNFFQFVNISNMTSKNASRNLAALLFKMRQAVSDETIKVLFKFNSRQDASISLQRTREHVLANFVPLYLGLGHINRQEFSRRHNTGFVEALLGLDPGHPDNPPILLPDSTYAWLEKALNLEARQKTYSVHKGKHLAKEHIYTACDGYILNVQAGCMKRGPYFANGANNDASIIQREINQDGERFLRWLEDGAIFIADRGYRDAVQPLHNNRLQLRIPAVLRRGQRQLTTADANLARLVTKIRWIQEMRNGHLKSKFKLLRDVFQMHNSKHIDDYFKIAAAIFNCFFQTVTLHHDSPELARNMVYRARQHENELRNLVFQNNWIDARGGWVNVDTPALHDFPRLNEEQIEWATCGIFQLRLAPAYIQDTQDRNLNPDFDIEVRIEAPGIVKARLNSRFRNRQRHCCWVQYVSANTEEPCQQNNYNIVNCYCTCKTGARTCGTCSHVTSIIWYLSFARHNPDEAHEPSRMLVESFIDCGVEEAA